MRKVQFSLIWRAAGLTNIMVSLIKVLLYFAKSFYKRALCSFPIVLSGSQESVRFLRPVARQNIGKSALRVIVKVANRHCICIRLAFIVIADDMPTTFFVKLVNKFFNKLN